MPAANPSISIDDVVVDESHNAVFRVFLSTPNWGQSVTVNFGTGGGDAIAGTDYTNGNGTLTFAPGVTEMFITIPVLDDSLSEATESFNVTLSGATNATIDDSVGTAYIQDNDNTPRPAVGDATATEGGAMVHTVTLSAAASTPVVYTFSLAGGTATAGVDFSSSATFSNGVTLSGGHITVPAGVTSFTVSYATIDDSLDEANETTVLSICQMSGTGTIVDNDSTPTLTVGNATANEGNNLTHTVTLSNASATATTYAFNLAGGTATAGVDFLTAPSFNNGVTINAGVITVPAGVTNFTVSYATINDAFDEKPFETTSLTIGTAVGTGNIYDNDAVPTLSVNDVTVNESAGSAVFTVTLSAASGQTVTVGFNMTDGSARAGSDYAALTGTITFAPGQTTKLITVPIINDTIAEATETFNVNLTGATNATIADATGVGTIIDNDPNGNPPDAVNDYGRVDHEQGVFRLNTTTASNQSNPDITSLTDGGYVAVWQSQNQDGSGWGIYSQRYDKDGDPVGGEQRVNYVTANNQFEPHVTALTGDRYLVTWTSVVAGGVIELRGQIFDENNNPFCHEFTVERISTPAPVQTTYDPIIGLPDGGFVVTWSASAVARNGGHENDGSGWGVFGQRYDATGNRVGEVFDINTTTANHQMDSDVTLLDNGKMVAVWTSNLQDGSGTGVYLRTFSQSATGMVADSGEVRVNTYTVGAQGDAEVTALNGGGFVVTWESAAQDGSGSGVYAQRYTASGSAVGSEFRVNTTTTGDQLNPVVTALADGGFIMAWQSASTARGAGYDIFKQQYNASGVAVGGETRVNSYTAGEQSEPVITTLSDGGYVIGWQSYGQDGSGMGTYAMRYTASGAPYVQSNFDMNEDASLTIAVGTLLANDTDPDNDTLTVTSVQDAQHGTVTLNANGTVTFVPAANYNGPAQFNYTISDGHGGNDTATVFLDVKPKGETSLMVGSLVTGQCGIGTGDVMVNEGSDAVFGVRVSGAATGSQLKLTLEDGTALNADYNEARFQYSADMGAHWTTVPANGLITLTNGFAQLMVRTDTYDDRQVEATETFRLRAELVSGGSATHSGTAQAQILDNDGPTIAVSSLSVNENTGYAQFTVSLSKASTMATSVSLGLANGTAIGGGVDYGNSGASNLQVSTNNGATWVNATSATFAVGQTSVLVRTPIIGDTLDEANETFTLTATRTAGITTNAAATGTATILDNDAIPSLTINDVAVNENAGVAVFTVTLSAASGQTVTAHYHTGNHTAAAGSDYTAVTGTVTFAPGTTTQTVTVPVLNDTVQEADESFYAYLTAPTNATVADYVGIGIILDNDRPNIASVSDATATEGAVLVHTVTLTAATGVATSYDFSLAGVTATAGSDFGTTPVFSNGVYFSGGRIHVPAGVSSFTVRVSTVNDSIDEAAETTRLTVGGVAATGTILDNDNVPTITSVSSDAVTEGGNLAHTVTLSNASSVVTTYSFSLQGNTATLGADFSTATLFSNGVTLSGGMLTVPAGVASFVINIPTINDTLDEPTETLTLGVGGVTATGTIYDNDSAPSISINDVTVNEAAGVAVFTVSLSAASSLNISVGYSTSNGTALVNSDYGNTFGTLSFAAGQTTQTVTVPIINDTVQELNETFNVRLASATNATISDTLGVGTIVDNDRPGISSVTDATATEGGILVHAVTLSAATGVVSTYAFSLAGTTATAVSDFGTTPTFSNGVTFSGGMITVPAGVSRFTVSVPTVNDTIDEPTETTALTVGGVTGIGNILDNDCAPTVCGVSNATVVEGATLVHTVSLSNASSVTTIHAFTLAGTTATAGSDFNATPTFSNGVTLAGGMVTVPAGVSSFTVSVATTNDSTIESTETTRLTVGGVAGVGTILDNDGRPNISINDITALEGGTATFTISLDHAYSQDVSVRAATANHTGRAGTHYIAFDTVVTIPAGQTSVNVSTRLPKPDGDWVAQDFYVNLTAPVNGCIVDNQGICKITDTVSPMILDLDGDGVRTADVAAGVNFDINNDGVARQVGWASAQDGLLVRDINRDGSINNGGELFGSATSDGQGGKTADGFQALGMLDDNKDGVINSLDLGWKDLQIWRDANTDGVTDKGELVSLESVGVQSMNLAHTLSDKVENGNLHMLVGDYTTTSGETREMTDVFFGTGDRLATEAVALHGQAATDTGLTFDPTASVWQVGAEDGNVVLKGFDINHDVLDLRDLLGGQQGDSLDGLLSIKKEGSSTVLEVKDAAGADHAIVFAGVDLIGGNTDQQVIHDLLNNHRVVVD